MGLFTRKYKRVTIEEWERLQKTVKALCTKAATNEEVERLRVKVDSLPTAEEFNRHKGLAQQAFDCMVGMIPDSQIRATKVGGVVVTTGFPNKQ
jgi:hypothetical protein